VLIRYTALANERQVAAATQNQALYALDFLYKQVPGQPLGALHGVTRARRPKRLPVVLSWQEVMRLMSQLIRQYLLITEATG